MPENDERDKVEEPTELAAATQTKEETAEELYEKAQKDLLYMRAEFDNYRKRMIKDQDQAIRSANRNFVSELLTIVDLFDRAIKAGTSLKTGASTELSNFISGIEMTRHELNQMLSRFGVELIGAKGETFDPNLHEAISQADVSDAEVDKVVEVFEKGAKLSGKVLKPARVVVGKKAG